MLPDKDRDVDVVVCGLATVDIVARPVPLAHPIGPANLLLADRIELTTGGMVSNSGIALAKLGMRTAAVACLGRDDWADVVRRRYQSEGLETTHLIAHPTARTSATIVLVDDSGERSFVFELGASRELDAPMVLAHRPLFARTRWMLFGYYSLFPDCDRQLPEIFSEVRKTGCRTALDVAGSGGGLEPLGQILPHVDAYVPSLKEAVHQTGVRDHQEIFATYRRLGAEGLVGLKLGAQGAILSPAPGEFLKIEIVAPPGAIVDTTGAGDAFFAGLLAGLIRGLPLPHAGRLAAAAGACCVTGLGATAGLRGWNETRELAGLELP
ncbi:MAG: hypothetical protein RIS70_834 [Planctomycetota bacterium]